MEAGASRPKAARRYAFACTQCRRRKLRCDGEQPECRRCKRSNETCQYPLRTLEQAQQRINELEVELSQLRQRTSPISTADAGSRVSILDADGANLPHEEAEDSDQDDISPHVGLDEHGELTYHGPTSRFYASSVSDRSLGTKTYDAALRERLQNSHVPALESHSDMLHQVWEPLLDTKTELELGAPPHLARRLLEIYWTWQHPLHNYVYRPTFIMDFAVSGPYYSKFLLHCIFALAARHLDYGSEGNEFANKGETFLASARALLVDELTAPKPRIPTIQGLLILGGRQCAVGNSSEGWIFTGMAIRMMTDLGLHLNLHRLVELENLTPVDLELRKRLYCSAYIWDKSLSLSLGRPPSLTRLSPAAVDMFDHGDDDAVWRAAELPDYPAVPTYNTTCFAKFCQLGMVIEDIMMPFSNTSSDSAVQSRLSKIERRLFDWYAHLPPGLKMDTAAQVCPPPHILSLNLLYHSLHVILWRPYMQSEVHGQHAINRTTEEAQRVHHMFVLYGRTFKWKKMTYLVSYCVYTAATIDVELMRSSEKQNREAAAKRLAVSLRILESEAQQTPGIRRSIDIIKRQLRTWSPQGHRQSDAALSRPYALSSPGSQDLTQHGVSQPLQEASPPESEIAISAPSVPASVMNSAYSNIAQQYYTEYTYDPWLTNQYNSYGQAPGGGMGVEFPDTGAGFQPDAFPWTNTAPFDPSYPPNTYYDDQMS